LCALRLLGLRSSLGIGLLIYRTPLFNLGLLHVAGPQGLRCGFGSTGLSGTHLLSVLLHSGQILLDLFVKWRRFPAQSLAVPLDLIHLLIGELASDILVGLFFLGHRVANTATLRIP
jgi:hypothetical protein